MSVQRATFWNHTNNQIGETIREDVTEAASIIWDSVRRMARAVLGDDADAAEIFERCLPRVSRYLDARSSRISTHNIKGLLFVSFRRELWTVKRKRAALMDIAPYSDRLRDPNWPEAFESRLEIENLVRQLSARTRTIITLRGAGYEWKEVASLLQTTVSEIKSSVSRELAKLRMKLRATSVDNRRPQSADLHMQVVTGRGNATFAASQR